MKQESPTFGKWLSAKREALKLSQQRLSDLTHGIVSKPYISLLENDRAHGTTGAPPKPSKKKIEALASALGVTVNEILSVSGWQINKPALGPEHAPNGLTPAQQLALQLINVMEPETRNVWLAAGKLMTRQHPESPNLLNNPTIFPNSPTTNNDPARQKPDAERNKDSHAGDNERTPLEVPVDRPTRGIQNEYTVVGTAFHTEDNQATEVSEKLKK